MYIKKRTKETERGISNCDMCDPFQLFQELRQELHVVTTSWSETPPNRNTLDRLTARVGQHINEIEIKVSQRKDVA